MGSTGSRPAAEQPTAPPDAPSTDEFEVVDGASAASESGAENSSSIHAEGPLIRGLGHATASLKVGTVAAIVALLTVPDEYQPMLRLAVQAALGLVMLWVWRFVLPALRAATEVGGPRGAEEGGGKGSNPNGELTLADALPGRIDTPGMLPLNKWGEPDGRSFNLRGPKYMSDQVKVPSDESFFKLVALDFFKFADHHERFGIASRPDNWVAQLGRGAGGGAGGGKPPFTFIMNVIIPSSANMSMLVYFQPRRPEELTSDKPEAKLLRAFINGDDAYRNERFKLLARPRGSAWIRNLIGAKPALIGKKLKMPYFSGRASSPPSPPHLPHHLRHPSGRERPWRAMSADYPPHRPNHFEVCVDVTSNAFAEYVTRIARDAVATNMSLDLGFTIEGRAEDELPERVFGACHWNKVDLLRTGVTLPPRATCGSSGGGAEGGGARG